MNVRILGVDKLMAKLNTPTLTGAQTSRFLRKSGKTIEGNVIDLAPNFDGGLFNSIETDVDQNYPPKFVRVQTDKEYAPPVEFGRKPGKMPPVAAVKPWADAHGIDPFVLARSIGRKGTKPHPFMKPGLEQSIPDIQRFLNQAAREVESGPATV